MVGIGPYPIYVGTGAILHFKATFLNSERMAQNATTNPAVNEALRSPVLAEVVRRVIEVAQPDRIILFGSAACGQMGPDSDIDLLVIKGGIASRRTLAQRLRMGRVAGSTAIGEWTRIFVCHRALRSPRTHSE